MGRDLEKSACDFPAAFGDRLRDFYSHSHHLKAAEWRNWTMLCSQIFLQDILPAHDFEAYCKFLDVIKLLELYELDIDEIQHVRAGILEFYQYYENRYYRQDFDRLPAMLSVFHQLLHIADFLESIGPMWSYSQWCTERMCGLIVGAARNRRTANSNMQINLKLEQQRHILPYVGFRGPFNPENIIDPVDAPAPDDPEHWIAESDDGAVCLHRMFFKLLHRPEPDWAKRSVEQQGHYFLDTCHKNVTFEGHEYRAIASYFHSVVYTEDDLDLPEIPRQHDRWKACNIPPPAKAGFNSGAAKAIGHDLANETSTRCASYVRYTRKDRSTNNVEHSFYGRVKFFFRIKFQDEDHDLAYVEEWKLWKDKILVCRAPRQQTIKIIRANQIKELVGLVTKVSLRYPVEQADPDSPRVFSEPRTGRLWDERSEERQYIIKYDGPVSAVPRTTIRKAT